MASNSGEWSLPATVRALLWWPGVSFVLVIVSPDIAGATIVAAGALLAAIGGLVSAITAGLGEQHEVTAAAAPALESLAAELTPAAIRAA